jgi:hypothetical protein
MSLGQFAAVAGHYAKAHSKDGGKPSAPTEDEFEAAVAAARGL